MTRHKADNEKSNASREDRFYGLFTEIGYDNGHAYPVKTYIDNLNLNVTERNKIWKQTLATVSTDMAGIMLGLSAGENLYGTKGVADSKKGIVNRGHRSYPDSYYEYEFYEGILTNKKMYIAIAYPGNPAPGARKRPVAAQMDSRLVLHLEVAIDQKKYLLGDRESAYYELIKKGELLEGYFINGNCRIAVVFKTIDNNFEHSQAMKDFIKDL